MGTFSLARRELVGEVGADGRGLRDDDVAVLERRHLAHGVDGQKLGLAVLALLEADELDVVGLAQLLQHPVHDRGARRGGVIECELGHDGLSLAIRRYARRAPRPFDPLERVSRSRRRRAPSARRGAGSCRRHASSMAPLAKRQLAPDCGAWMGRAPRRLVGAGGIANLGPDHGLQYSVVRVLETAPGRRSGEHVRQSCAAADGADGARRIGCGVRIRPGHRRRASPSRSASSTPTAAWPCSPCPTATACSWRRTRSTPRAACSGAARSRSCSATTARTPSDAVRVAEELLTRENVSFLVGTFLSNVGLAVADFANQKKMLFLATEPLTDAITMAQATSTPTASAPRPTCRPRCWSMPSRPRA